MRLILGYEKGAAKKMPGSFDCGNQLVNVSAVLGNCSIAGTLCTVFGLSRSFAIAQLLMRIARYFICVKNANKG
jgi:hypothetical protein